VKIWLPYWIKWNWQHERRLKAMLAMTVGGMVIWAASLLLPRQQPKLSTTPFLLMMIPAAIGVVVWFITAPNVNFGYGWLSALGILLIGGALLRSHSVLSRSIENYSSLLGKLALAVLMVFVLGKIGYDALKHRGDFLLHWPLLPSPEYDTKQTANGVTYYLLKNDSLCWDAPIMCTANDQMTVLVDDNGAIREIDTQKHR
jgi:hypothetical protein